MRVTPSRSLPLLLFGLLAPAAPAEAQSLTPMRGEIRSMVETFAVRVYPTNPYNSPIQAQIRVYDQDFAPIAARISTPDLMLPAQGSRTVLVAVPFEGRAERKIRICVESIPFPQSATRIRTQVCGRFIGIHAS